MNPQTILEHNSAPLSAPTRALHWILALAMIGLTAVGLYMAEFEAWALYPIHKSIGLLVLPLALALALGPDDVPQTETEGQHAAEVSEAPAPARHAAHAIFARQLRQEWPDMSITVIEKTRRPLPSAADSGASPASCASCSTRSTAKRN